MIKKFLIPLLFSFSIPAALMVQATTLDEARKIIDDALPGDLANDPRDLANDPLSFQWET